MRKPRFEHDRACSHEPDPSATEARRRARPTESVAFKRRSALTEHKPSFQALCVQLAIPVGALVPPRSCHRDKAQSNAGSGDCKAHVGSSVCIVEDKASNEERNADGARSAVLLTLIPPHLTGTEV